MKLWRADTRRAEVVEVECPNGRYPAKDADGKTVFDNTHFESMAEAIECVMRNAEAGVCLSASAFKQARFKLRECQRRCAEAAVIFEKAVELSRQAERLSE